MHIGSEQAYRQAWTKRNEQQLSKRRDPGTDAATEVGQRAGEAQCHMGKRGRRAKTEGTREGARYGEAARRRTGGEGGGVTSALRRMEYA